MLAKLLGAYYLKKLRQDDTVLHYQRTPTWRSLVLFTVLLTLTHFISTQAPYWYIVVFCYVFGTYFSYIATEQYEECIFDKRKGTVSLMNTRFLEKHILGYRRKIVTELCEVVGVGVEGQKVSYGGTGHQVVLVFVSGLTLSLTAQCTFGDTSKHQKIVKEIKEFLELPSANVGTRKSVKKKKEE